MNRTFAQRLGSVRTTLDRGIFLPLLLVLSLVAIVHALQSYGVLHTASGALTPFGPILVSRLAYYWYFVLLAFVIERQSTRIALTRRTALLWCALHLATLLCSFLIHEAMSLAIDAAVLQTERSDALLVLLFNNPAIWIESFAYTIILLGFTLLDYQRINRDNEITCARLEAQLTKTTLQELRNTIQPTFLFNTLHAIHALVREHRNQDANHVLALLSDFLRTTVYDNDRDEITVDEELRFLTHYIEIEQVRSRLPFTMRQEIGRDVHTALVPNFMLQPIVEELLFGRSRHSTSPSELVIRARKADAMLEVEIEECSPETADVKGNRAGGDVVLDISRKRLAQLYGTMHEMTIRRIGGGLVVRMRIPFSEAVTESEGTFIGEPVS